MTNINEIVLIGTLTKAAELKYTPTGTAILELNVGGEIAATKNSGEPFTIVFYQRVKLIGKQAETYADLAAGTPVLVSGSLAFEQWDDKATGQKRSKVEVKATSVETIYLEDYATNVDSMGGIRLCAPHAVNHVRIAGNLTRDIEVKATSGQNVANGGICANESWKDKLGNWINKPHFVNLQFWGGMADLAGGISKGAGAYVEGRLSNSSYDNKEGVKVYTTQIEVSTFIPFIKPNAVVSKPRVETVTVDPNEFAPFDADDSLPI